MTPRYVRSKYRSTTAVDLCLSIRGLSISVLSLVVDQKLFDHFHSISLPSSFTTRFGLSNSLKNMAGPENEKSADELFEAFRDGL